MPTIRGVALGALRHPASGAYLVQRLSGTDDTHFHRFIGGGIEPGESSDAALEREFQEELAVDIEVGPPVCTVENLFEWDGNSHHELVVVRAAAFVDDSLYDRDSYRGVDDADGAEDDESADHAGDDRVEYEAYWRTLSELRAAEAPFFPAGVADALESEGQTHVVSPPEADAAAVEGVDVDTTAGTDAED